MIEEMQWWHDEMHQWLGKVIISAKCQIVEARGFWLLLEEGMSNNAQDLSGVKLTVKVGLEHFRNRFVLVETEHKITQAYINHLGGRSPF